MDTEKMRQQLIARLTENYADYRAELLTNDRQELIDKAGQIADTKNTFEYLTSWHEFDESQLKFMLKFQNPLEVAAPYWTDEYRPDDTAFSTVVQEICDNQDELKRYPLVTDANPKEPLRKFLNVDVIAAMQSIMGEVTAHFQSDFKYDKERIAKAVRSEEPEKRNLLWLCRESGTHLHEERDVFIKGTASFNNIQFYHRDCQSEKAALYSVEITGVKNGVVRGNIYERDRHQYAELAGRGASPRIGETLTFISGEELRLSCEEFNDSRQSDLEYEYGKLMEVRHEAEDESVVQGALLREHERREKLPKGTISTHVQKLADQRIQAEADRITSAFENLNEPNSPNKTHKMVKLSDDFTFMASSRDTDRLLDTLLDRVKNDTLHFSGLNGEKGIYCFIKPEKPSIKAQLAARQTATVPVDQLRTKSKDEEIR